MNMTSTPDPQLQQALALHRQGQLAAAAQLYRSVLQRQPQQVDALQMLGLVLAAQGDAAQALQLLDRAAAIAPALPVLQFNRGLTLLQLERLPDAIEAFDRVLALDPRYAKAWQMKAVAIDGLGRRDEALQVLERGSQSGADATLLLQQHGAWLYESGRFAEALASFERVSALQPKSADGLVNVASTLLRLDRPGDALRVLNRAAALGAGAPDIHFNRGVALAGLRRWSDAVQAYSETIRLQPGLLQAWVNRGVASGQLRDFERAIADFEHVLRLQPANADARMNLGNTLLDAGNLAAAVGQYEQVVLGQPERENALESLLHARMRICDWRDFESLRERVAQRVALGGLVSPARLLFFSDDAALQKRCAEDYARQRQPALADAAPVRTGGGRIRVGYFSSDFHEHATAFLMARVFESHDREAFETMAFSFGHPPADAMHARLRPAFDHFFDVSDSSDEEIVALARARGLDIAVDLKGLTHNARPRIFALRAAPVQVAYLGYPSTMGAPYFDYLVADPVIVPPAAREHYTEKIASLPYSYQANDDTRVVPAPTTTRAQEGLGESGFVFCCFNALFKLTPEVFDVWMRLLQRVPGSVLWLFEGHPLAAGNLRKEAQARGVDPARLVFAPLVDPAAHLARQAHADLFLDTLPCNAHTTGSDALWAGLPMVTCAGGSFASRVAASLLQAVGLPELVTQSLADYEALAAALASDPQRLAQLRARLRETRASAPLFDSPGFTRHLEAAYGQMAQRLRAGLPPDHVDVAAARG